jgi:phosphoribosylglycinamide formyltransferase-1
VKKRLLALISGGGTNMQAVIDAIDEGSLDGEIVAVISSNKNAFGLERAKKAGIETFVLPLSDFSSRQERDEEIIRIAEEKKVDYILLLGYLGILTKEVIERFPRRIINIHPALLPAFGGEGFFGLNVHRAVIAAGEKQSGATVHYVDEGTDTGEIIIQKSIEVKEDDTAETLQKRILSEVEHSLIVVGLQKVFAENS